MTTFVVYDSQYGNTEKVAQAIGTALRAEVQRAGAADPAHLQSGDLLIVGSPTQGGRPTQAMQAFLAQIPAANLKGLKAATFDTRARAAWVKIFGNAADRMGKFLTGKGATLMTKPEGFFVMKTEGPLAEGELARAASWAEGLAKS